MIVSLFFFDEQETTKDVSSVGSRVDIVIV